MKYGSDKFSGLRDINMERVRKAEIAVQKVSKEARKGKRGKKRRREDQEDIDDLAYGAGMH